MDTNSKSTSDTVAWHAAVDTIQGGIGAADANGASAKYPAEFRPQATKDLVRVGAQYDGGYVMPARLLPASEGLLSFGLSDQWEFEEAFFAGHAKPVVCFDHTVDGMFWLRKTLAGLARSIIRLSPASFRRAFRFVSYWRFFDGQRCRHIRMPLGYPENGAVDLKGALQIAGLEADVLLKMDIEGWEYRALGDIASLRDKFTGIAIELHDVDIHRERIVSFIQELSDKQLLVHFHANSHTTVGPGRQSIVVEMTFMHRRLLQQGEPLEYRPLPIKHLDAPNLPWQQEAVVRFEGAA